MSNAAAARIAAVTIAAGVGLGGGWVVRQLRIPAILQDIAATFLGWVLGSAVVPAVYLVGMMFSSPAGSSGLGAASFGVTETIILGPLTAALVAVIGRIILHRLAPNVAVSVVLGGLGALAGAMWVARTLTVSMG